MWRQKISIKCHTLEQLDIVDNVLRNLKILGLVCFFFFLYEMIVTINSTYRNMYRICFVLLNTTSTIPFFFLFFFFFFLIRKDHGCESTRHHVDVDYRHSVQHDIRKVPGYLYFVLVLEARSTTTQFTRGSVQKFFGVIEASTPIHARRSTCQEKAFNLHIIMSGIV